MFRPASGSKIAKAYLVELKINGDNYPANIALANIGRAT